MNNHKYFKVIQIETKNKKQILRVEGYDNWVEMLFGLGRNYPLLEEDSFPAAIRKITDLVNNKIIKEKVIYKLSIDKLGRS